MNHSLTLKLLINKYLNYTVEFLKILITMFLSFLDPLYVFVLLEGVWVKNSFDKTTAMRTSTFFPACIQ